MTPAAEKAFRDKLQAVIKPALNVAWPSGRPEYN